MAGLPNAWLALPVCFLLSSVTVAFISPVNVSLHLLDRNDTARRSAARAATAVDKPFDTSSGANGDEPLDAKSSVEYNGAGSGENALNNSTARMAGNATKRTEVFANYAEPCRHELCSDAFRTDIRKMCPVETEWLDYENDQALRNSANTPVVYLSTFYADELRDFIKRLDEYELWEKPVQMTILHINSRYSGVIYLYRNIRIGYVKYTSEVKPGRIPTMPTGIDGKRMFPLYTLKEVDARFMQAYISCYTRLYSYEKRSYGASDMSDSDAMKMIRYPIPKKVVGDGEYSKLSIIKEGSRNYLESFTFSDEEKETAKRLPYLSFDYQQKNVEMFLQIAEGLTSEKLSIRQLREIARSRSESASGLRDVLISIGHSKIQILQSNVQRSKSMALVALKKRDDTEKQLNASRQLVAKLTKTFEKYKEETEEQKVAFYQGVRRRQAEMEIEMATSIVNSLLSFFSGGFNPAKFQKAYKKAGKMVSKITKLKKVFRKLWGLIRRLGNAKKLSRSSFTRVAKRNKDLFQQLKKVKDTSEKASSASKVVHKVTKRIAKGIGKINEIVAGIIDAKKNHLAAVSGFDPGDSQAAIDEGRNIDASDVLQWDVASAHVRSMMDASLSAEIPETGGFKNALFKLNLAGKAKTQAMIDEVTIGTDYLTHDFEYTTYLQDAVSIQTKIDSFKKQLRSMAKDSNTKIKKAKKELDKELIGMDLKVSWRILLTKLSLIKANGDYCNSYFYFHLDQCPPQFDIDLGMNLTDIIYNQRLLQQHSLSQLRTLHPPPQTFSNVSLIFRKPENCQCVKSFTDIRDDETLLKYYRKAAACLNIDLKNNEVPEDVRLNISALIDDCNNNKISDMQTFKRIVIDIPLTSNFMADKQRVRVDDVQVFLHGAKTESGTLEIWIETSGLYEDRFKGEEYKFYGDPWSRLFSYSSDRAKLGNQGNHDLSEEQTVVHFSTNVHNSFQGVYRMPTLFTTWIMSVHPKANKGLDLSDLSMIEVRFSGSFVADEDYTDA